jgi:hypothetical protein|tara:strand:- start:398 stop:670 length:273 start_codon:yes stop_codon:yes gene_type:complete
MTRTILNKLIVYRRSNGYTTFREALYNEDGDLALIGETPAYPRGLSLNDLEADLEEFSAALDRTVINEDDIDVDDDIELDDFDIDGELPN